MVTITANKETNVRKIYQNAQLIWTGNCGNFTLESNFKFGLSKRAVTNASYFLDGSLAEISIDNIELDIDIIEARYNEGKGLTL